MKRKLHCRRSVGPAALTVSRYDNIDYLKNDHRNSEPFKKLQEYVPSWHTTLDPKLTRLSNVAKLDTRSGPPELSFFTSKGGFLGRDETPSLPLGDQFIWLAKLKAHPGKRDEMIKAALIHADNVKRTEDETLSFVVLESTEDDVSIVLFERYTSEKYFKDVHAVSETMQEYRGKVRAYPLPLV